jgi:hypothetical protein
MGALSIFSMFLISVKGIVSKTASPPIRANETASLFQTTRRFCHRLEAVVAEEKVIRGGTSNKRKVMQHQVYRESRAEYVGLEYACRSVGTRARCIRTVCVPVQHQNSKLNIEQPFFLVWQHGQFGLDRFIDDGSPLHIATPLNSHLHSHLRWNNCLHDKTI